MLGLRLRFSRGNGFAVLRLVDDAVDDEARDTG